MIRESFRLEDFAGFLERLIPGCGIEVFAILVTESMANIFPDPVWLKIYFTLKFGLFFVFSANILAVSGSENPFNGSKLPKLAITFAVMFYTLKVFKSGNP